MEGWWQERESEEEKIRRGGSGKEKVKMWKGGRQREWKGKVRRGGGGREKVKVWKAGWQRERERKERLGGEEVGRRRQRCGSAVSAERERKER